jgi:hypothetical protein
LQEKRAEALSGRLWLHRLKQLQSQVPPVRAQGPKGVLLVAAAVEAEAVAELAVARAVEDAALMSDPVMRLQVWLPSLALYPKTDFRRLVDPSVWTTWQA